MMTNDNKSGRIRVNISLSTEVHARLKAAAKRKDTSVSHLISELAKEHLPGPLCGMPKPTWPQDLPLDATQRIEAYAEEHHTTPVQAVTDWIWSQKVKNENLKGQLSF